MKMYSKEAFRVAQLCAKAAVEGGSKNGYEFDWDCGMRALMAAYGYAPLSFAERFYDNEG